MKNFKKSLALLLSVFLIAGVTACGKEKTKTTGTDGKEEALSRTIKVAYDGHLCQAPVALAEFNGFFEAEGLDVELVKTGGTVDNVRDAIAGGKIDASGGMIAAWLKPITNGIDMRFVVGLHTGCTSAFVLADSPTTGFEKGQKVAISGGIGGSQHNIAYRFIAHDGFVPDDFSWANYEADQLLLILQRGDADIVVTSDQLAEKWVNDGSLKRVRSQHLDEDFKEEACCILGVSGEFVDNNPEATKKLANAVYKASKWLDESDENKHQAAKLLIDKGYISTTEDYAVELFQFYNYGLSNEQTESALLNSLNEFKTLGVLDSKVVPEDAVKQIFHPSELSYTPNATPTNNAEHSQQPQNLAITAEPAETETETPAETSAETEKSGMKDCCIGENVGESEHHNSESATTTSSESQHHQSATTTSSESEHHKSGDTTGMKDCCEE